jgi:putative restriction endonuclease
MGEAADFFVGVTDNAWFSYLRSQQATEVNFWRPSGLSFKALRPGGLFLFKLHAPDNVVVGGGLFVRASRVSVHQAWDWFETANGCPDRESFVRRMGGNPAKEITCILLAEVFYFPEDLWLSPPASFAAHIQVGKGYRIADEPEFYRSVADRIQGTEIREVSGSERYGAPQMVLPRLGQGLFRGVVAEAYGRRCAVTEERALPVLEAAHIVPYAAGGEHALENGLLLRSDLHRLFDAGYITVDPDDRVLIVSRRLSTEFHNGHEYLRLHGRPVSQPANGLPPPSKDNLLYHAQHIFAA